MDKDIERLGKERLGRQKKHKKWMLLTIILSVIALSASVYNLIQPAHATVTDGSTPADLSAYIYEAKLAQSTYDEKSSTVTANYLAKFQIDMSVLKGTSSQTSSGSEPEGVEGTEGSDGDGSSGNQEQTTPQLAFYYDLPAGISIPSDCLNKTYYATDETNSGVNVFSYKYEQMDDGHYRIQITILKDYYDQCVTNEATEIHGQFSIQLSIGKNNLKDGETYTTTIGTTEITVNMKDVDFGKDTNSNINRDISAYKWCNGIKFDGDDTYLEYQIQVKSQNGTNGDPVNISDALTYSNFTIQNVTVTSVEKGYQDYLDLTKNSVITGAGDSGTGKYTTNFSLPELAANGYYIVTYRYKITGLPEGETPTATASNKATVTSQGSKDWDVVQKVTETYETKVSKTIITKSGTANAKDGYIEWKITVNSAGSNIAGYELTDDAFSTAQGLEIKCTSAEGDVSYIEDLSGNKITFKAVGETGQNSNTYVITYKQYVSSTYQSTTYSNTAYFGPKDGTKQEATANASISSDGLTKTVDSANVTESGTGDNRTLTIPWNTTIAIPETGITEGTTYSDTLQGNYGSICLQWFTLDQMQDIYEKLCGFWGTDTFTFYVYDLSNMWTRTQYTGKSGVNSDIKYYKFEVVFNKNFIPKNLTNTLSYSSMAAVPDSGLGASSGSWWLKNSTAFGSMNADATYEYKKTVVKSDSTSWDAADMSESDAGTLAVGKTTSWRIRILLKNDLLENSVTLTDKLPKGLKLSAIAISSDAYSNYTELSLGEADSTGKRSISGTYALSDGKSISASGSSQYDNTNFDTVTVTFSGDLSELKDMPLYVKVTCEVTDAFYADLGEDETMVAATNTATVTFGSDKTYWSNTQTKKITMPKASTVAKTYYSDRADGEGKLLYAVSINPEGADLDDGDTLELDDVLKYDPNIKKDSKTGTYTLTLITDSVKLYESDGNGAFEVNADGTVTNGTPVNIDAWSYVPGGSDTSKEETRTLHLEVPDGKVLMLVYMYQITTDLKDISFSTNITNTATLTGKKQYTSTENNAKAWKYSSVQANGGSDKSYTFKKVEKDKWNKKLGGAVFTLYKYKPDTDEFVSTGLTYTTISGDQTKNVNVGTFSINYKNDQAAYGYTYDTAYYLMETTSPDGYDLPEEKDRTKYYFYFSKPVSDTTVEGASEEESGTECMPTDFKTDTEKYHAVDLTTTSASAVVENTPALTIRKVWTNTNGDSLEVDPDIVVKVVVHRLENGEDKGNCWEVLLTSGNNWTYTDKTLSTVSADGVVYTYEAEEVSVYKDGDGTELKGNYDVSYDNNGISVGGITITNQLIAQYELPQTGGSGRTLWYMFGGILVLGAGFLLIYRKHKII